MSDTVKLIIEIPKVTYNDIKVGKIYSSLRDVPLESAEAIKNGIPLDDVKVEIKEKCDTINHITSHLPYSTHRFVQELLSDIMEIIKGVENGPQEIQ